LIQEAAQPDISSTFCPAPWAISCVNANNTVGLCCLNHHHNIKTTDQTSFSAHEQLDAIKQSMLRGKPIQGCDRCYIEESNNFQSLRQKYIRDFLPSLDLNRLAEKTYQNVVYFDLSLESKCNQKCRICGPYNSTAWLKDAAQLFDLEWSHVNHMMHAQPSDDTDMRVQQILHTMQATDDDIQIELKGGEPLYMDSVHDLLAGMVRLGIHQRTSWVRIFTNGTQYEQKLLDMLAQFPALNLAISIDAVGKLHEYTRGSNISWDDCRRRWNRLLELPNIKRLKVSNTIYAYNLHDVGNLHAWARSEFGPDVLIANSILHSPPMLRNTLLPQHWRTAAANSIDSEEFGGLVDYLHKPIGPEEFGNQSLQQVRDRFRIYTARLDQIRNESFRDLVPELAGMLF
jgi:4Fe-4S single cluster domain